MVRWFDPIGQAWRKMPEKPAPVEIIEVPENQIVLARRLDRDRRIWQAVVATSTSSNMAGEAPCEDPQF